MTEEALMQSTPAPAPAPAPAGAGAQPAFGKKRYDVAHEAPACTPPCLHPGKLVAPRAAPDSFAERPLRGAGSLVGAEVFACRQYPNDIRKQIVFLCQRDDIPAGTGRLRSLGNARRAAVRNIMLHLVTVLNQCAEQTGDPSLRLRNTTEFGTHHLLAILGSFAAKKTKRSTMHNQLSVLRKCMTLLGRRHLVPGTDELALLVIERDLGLDFGSRSYTAYVPHAWSAVVDVERVLQHIQNWDKHAFLLCELCLAFGLRETEALCLCPVESDFGDRLLVWRGSKGGRERWVPFSADPERRAQQRKVLDRAQAACCGDRLRYLGYGDRTLKQAHKYFQSVLAKCGVTQSRLGIKLHGLRHEYAVRRFQELTGLPAPVLRQAPISAYVDRMALVRQAREQITAELGHGRAGVVSAYIGSLPTLREEAKQTELAAQVIGQHRAALERLGIAAVTLAVRKTAARRHTYTVYVQPADAPRFVSHEESLVRRMQESAREWLGRNVNALLTAAPAQPGTVTISV
jgi:site-specific recombinase XerD